MLLNPAKCKGYTFYHFWVIKGKATRGGGVKLPPSQPRLGFSNVLIHFIKSYPKAYRFQADPKKK